MRKAICTGASFVALLVLCACFFPVRTGGADAMAVRGAGYDEILAWYYTGAELKVPAGVAV